ncbi:MAG TPA: phosphotransferase family protein [Amycolatopsis sp.]|nr:phosphotransferase family protein [Amycolatopsis sp.]
MADVNEDRGYVAPLRGSQREPGQLKATLGNWLRQPLGATSAVRVDALSTPRGTGVANETLLFDACWSDARGEHEAAMVARVATDNALYLDADIETSFRMYEALAEAPGVPVPRVWGFEGDPSILGAPFFVMDRIAGDVPGDNPHWSEAGFVRDATPAQRRRLWETAVDALAALHQVPASKFPFLESADGRDGLSAHLDYWRRYLDWVRPRRDHELLEAGWEYLQAHVPPGECTGISWGDARIENIIFRDYRCVSVLDWDTVSLAGAEADLGWWAVMNGTYADDLPGIGTPDELVERWEAATGRRAGNLHFHLVFTTFRLATVLCKLFAQMREAGLMTPEEATYRATHNDQLRQMSVLIGAPPPSGGPVILPHLTRAGT